MEEEGGLIRGSINIIRDKFTQLFNLIEEKTGLITILRQVWNDVAVMFQEELLPELKKLWKELQPLMPFLKEFAKVIGIILFGVLIGFIQLLRVGLIVTINVLTRAIRIATSVVKGFKAGWDFLTDTLAKIINQIDSLISKIKELNVFKAARNFVSGVLGFGGGRAEGGFVQSNKSFLVGERGPELFIPNVAGNIVPNNKLAGAGGITLNISGNTFLDDTAAEHFGDQIVRVLKQNIRI